MELLLEALTYHRHSDQPLSVLVILIIRVTLVLVIGWLISLASAKRSAAWEHQVWLLTLLTTLLVPVVWAVTPAWRLPLVALQVSGSALDTVRAVQAGQTWQGSAPGALADWPQMLLAAWIVGATLALAHALWSVACAVRMVRQSRACRCAEWHSVVNEVREELGFARSVELRWLPRGSSPAVWGWRRVRVLVPLGSDRWPRTEQRHVVMHELAHATRRDCLWRLVANVVCAVWWFHPLVWLASARLRAAGERAADDCVVRGGSDVSDYAQHLLTIATRLSGMPQAGAAPTMMRPSQLEIRLLNLLAPGRDRSPLGTTGRTGTCLATVALVWILATWTPTVVRATPPIPVQSPSAVKPRTGRTLIIVRPNQPAQSPIDIQSYTTPLPNGIDLGPPAEVLSVLEPRDLKLGLTAEDRSGFNWSTPDSPGVTLSITPIKPPAPPIIKLIPNWEAGRKADAKLPNYQPGMAKIQLLNPAAAPVAENLGQLEAMELPQAQPVSGQPGPATPQPAAPPAP